MDVFGRLGKHHSLVQGMVTALIYSLTGNRWLDAKLICICLGEECSFHMRVDVWSIGRGYSVVIFGKLLPCSSTCGNTSIIFHYA